MNLPFPIILISILITTMVYTGGVHAASIAPVLRLDPGMHFDMIKDIGTDATGRLVLTCSTDKTARLWRMDPAADGETSEDAVLLKTLRPPLWEGEEGMLFACALSADGTRAAVGGWTGKQWSFNKGFCIYIFDTASGGIVQHLKALPNVVNALRFSPDGRFLAAAFGGRSSWQLLEVGTGRTLHSENGNGDVYGLSWHQVDEDGARLVTGGRDGTVWLYRVYAVTGRCEGMAQISVPAGLDPPGVAFSPDGHRVAVGHGGKAGVTIHDAETLKQLSRPSAAGLMEGNLRRVAWMADGSLAAGGTVTNREGRTIVRVWPDGGRGTPQDVAAGYDTILTLASRPGYGVLFGTADPLWGHITPSDSKSKPLAVLHGPRAVCSFLGLAPKFSASANLDTLAVSRSSFGGDMQVFSLVSRHLAPVTRAAQMDGLKTPKLEGMPVTLWLHASDEFEKQQYLKMGVAAKHIAGGTWMPHFGGEDIRYNMSDFEPGTALAVSPDNGFFLLGSIWTLYCYDEAGGRKWAFDTASSVRAINISRDTRLAAVAYADGILRWYDARRGKPELLSLFMHPDGRRWIAWTADGRYDCSPGAEELLGWHVDRVVDKPADFHPLSQFRQKLYAPDWIATVLKKHLQSDEAANEVSAGVPKPAELIPLAPPQAIWRSGGPLMEVSAPAGEQEVELKYGVRSFGVRPSAVRLLLDGRLFRTDLPVPSSNDEEVAVKVPLAAGAHELALIAESPYGAGQPARLRIVGLFSRGGGDAATASGKQAPATPPVETAGPKLWLFAVGVSELKNQTALGFAQIHYADDDARALSAAFARQNGLLYSSVESRILADQQATAQEVSSGLRWLSESCGTGDVAVFFLAGHGENDSTGRYYFCAHDYDDQRRETSGVSFETIRDTLASVRGKVLFFVDTCHAGNALGKLAPRGGSSDINRVINELVSAENGAVVFTACTGRQQAYESDDPKSGLFTRALVEGLQGGADLFNKGKVTVSTLEAYVSDRVTTWSEGRQTPAVTKPDTVPDFPVSVTIK
jgi:WD40 repeat protein